MSRKPIARFTSREIASRLATPLPQPQADQFVYMDDDLPVQPPRKPAPVDGEPRRPLYNEWFVAALDIAEDIEARQYSWSTVVLTMLVAIVTELRKLNQR